jgi:hypothetical protein
MAVSLTKKLICALSVCIPTITFAQNTDQNVTGTAGGFDTTASYSVSWTIGEPVTSTVSSGEYTLTQGFQQSTWEIVGIEENTTQSSLDINLYPNPATDHVYIQVNSEKDTNVFRWKLTTLNGKIVKNGTGRSSKTRLSLTNLHKSVYIITVSFDNTLNPRVKNKINWEAL